MRTKKYDVWSFDVWGNETDGFQINHRSCFQRAVEFPTTHRVFNQGALREFSTDNPSNEQILDTLIEIGFLISGVQLDEIEIDGESDFSLWIEDATNGFPICQLEFVEG